MDLPTLRQSSRERKKATEQIKNMTLARIEVERRRDMPKDLGSNPNECHIFLVVPLRTFFLCYSCEALEGPISTGVSNKHNNIDSNNGILISKKYYTIYIYA